MAQIQSCRRPWRGLRIWRLRDGVNAGVTGPPGPVGRDRRNRGGGGRPRRSRMLITLSTLVGVIACTLLVAFGAEAVVARAACTAHPVVVNVAAASEIAPAIQHVGKFFNAE